jgi:uncharacterized membrane protein
VNPLLAFGIAAIPAFLASVVEFVEAFTIVLAVGNTRGWRAPLWGTLGAVGTLAVIVGVFGTPLIVYHEQISQYFHLAVGTLLLLFGMRWLRKAILRFAGIIALHDEELIYTRKVAELRDQGQRLESWDNLGFWFSYKAVLLEGLEVAFIVITLGSQGSEALQAAVVGAAAAFVLTSVMGMLLREPLQFVPENWMKFLVGAMLVTFGVFWGSEGFRAHWVYGEGTIPVLFATICCVSFICVRMLSRLVPSGAQVAAKSV